MSAGRHKATEDVLVASNVDSCESLQLVSHIQQYETLSTDGDAIWKTIYLRVFGCLD